MDVKTGGQTQFTHGLDTESEFGTHKPSLVSRLIWRAADWSALPQSWRQRFRKRFARPHRGPYDVFHERIKWRLYPAENYCDRVIFGRSRLPEQAEHDALAPYIFPGMVFVDIGANVGSYSLFVGTRAMKGEGNSDLTLLAFEPHPRTHAKLLFNLRANGLPMNNVVNGGVAGQAGSMALWSDGGSNIGHTSMLKAGTSNPKVSVNVPVVALVDELANRNVSHIDLLKIDIEGFEDRALAPFLDSAPKSLLPRMILIETAHAHLWERDLTVLLEELGYEAVFETPENRLLERITD